MAMPKKLEWDFEGDGIFDWTSTIDNKDWTGKADITHIYGAPGIYHATLKIHTEANLSATDSVLVVISSNGVPPKARATVSYKNNKGLTSITGDTIPLNARFEHSGSTGSIVKYEWDLDGDKRIDVTTKSSKRKVVYHYRLPGYYVASLRVTDSNGLTDTCYIPVFVYYPAGYASQISIPEEAQTIAGNAITITCDVFPDDNGVNEVMFQYRQSGDTSWTDISIGKPVMSYTTSWDTTSLIDGATYEIRAIVNGLDSSSFGITSVVVDNSIPNPDIYENNNGSHSKKTIVDPGKSTLIILPNGIQIEIPFGALPDDGSAPELTVDEKIGFSAGVGNSIDINITAGYQFLKDITIFIPYDDENNDGIVDGTNINENDLVVKWFNPQTGQWEALYYSVVYPDENIVSAKVNHLSLFGLGALVSGAVSAAGGGASSALGAIGGSSYCFIATACYDSPESEEVMTLRIFRDQHLMKNRLGRKFVSSYYRYSPPIARFIKDRPLLKIIVRSMLKPLVDMAKNKIVIASEAKQSLAEIASAPKNGSKRFLAMTRKAGDIR